MLLMAATKKEPKTFQNPLDDAEADHFLLRSYADLTPEHPVGIVAYVHGPGSWRDCALPHPRQIEPIHRPHICSVKAHGHKYCELGFVVSGSARHLTRSGRFEAGAGSVHFVPLHQVHAFNECRTWYVVNVCYLADWIVDDLRLLRREESLLGLFLSPELFMHVCQPAAVDCSLNPDEWRLCMEEIDNIAGEQARPTPSHMFVRACLQKLLLTVARAAAREYSEYPGVELPRAAWRAIEIVEEGMLRRELPTVAALAREVGLSESHFCREFRKALGRTPKDYLQVRRIQHACKLLLNPDQTITEVAMELGFATGAHFCSAFRKYRGVSPREYRKHYAAARDMRPAH
jgi:AraC-like DNA-binding protein/mannose-6-phosphate isomerase-like protein (cupin superfamily)